MENEHSIIDANIRPRDMGAIVYHGLKHFEIIYREHATIGGLSAFLGIRLDQVMTELDKLKREGHVQRYIHQERGYVAEEKWTINY